MFIAMQYMGFAIKGKPYMGVGRNLAYKKSLFFKNKGFCISPEFGFGRRRPLCSRDCQQA
jgi:hypothetical protein